VHGTSPLAPVVVTHAAAIKEGASGALGELKAGDSTAV
jgi:hypothetical protein